MWNKKQIIMLPTKDKTSIVLGDNLLVNVPGQMRGANFHLFVISDEEIHVGDWIISKNTAPLMENYWCNLFVDGELIYPNMLDLPQWKRIIATTKDVLIASFDVRLPAISKSFIDLYIQKYNEGNKIEEVEVEYQYIYDTQGQRFNLIVNDDNTINIRTAKNSWNREEVANLIQQACEDCCFNPTLITNWLIENLQ